MEIDSLPLISVLIAARNEEANIARCLQAICDQDYPREKIEVWIGNDQSDDGTADIVGSFLLSYPNMHLLQIESSWKHLRGKANVLAQLAHKARGDYFFVTDADVCVEPTWIRAMLPYFAPGSGTVDFAGGVRGKTGPVGIITGVTAVDGHSLFARLQNAEWILYTASGHLHAEKGRPVTAMGNNMAVSAAAYRSTGGYENIPFSVTEDYELFRAVRRQGYTFRSAFEHDVLGHTRPIPAFAILLQQRKRWFTGAFQLPRAFVIGLVGLWAFFPILVLIGLFLGWITAAVILGIKWIMDIVFISRSYHRLQLKPGIAVWLYTFYSGICNTIFLLYQVMPIPVQWKGRKYHTTYDTGGIEIH